MASIIFIAFIFGSFVFGKRVFSYDTKIAHPSIVTIAGLEYNKIYDPDLTLEEIGWMADGAVEEDMPTRWLNHFYDPFYNKGLNNGKYPTSKDWSRMTNYQTTFALGDQTWYRAIDYWKKDDKKKAFKALGHILHLIADASVPAHTRDDPHPTGDSYEQFVKNNWLTVGKFAVGFEKKQVNNLYEVFDAVANYSNNNFYSDDTILSSKYNTVNIVEEKEEKNTLGKIQSYKYASVGGVKYRVYVSDVNFVWQKKNETGVSVKDQFILADYSKHLLLTASSYSIATINLFFQEVKKEQNVKLAKYKTSLVGAADYLLGTVINKVEDLYNMFKGKNESLVMAGESPLISATTNNTNLSLPIVDDTIQDTSNKIQTNNKTQNTINKTQTTAAVVEEPVVVVEMEKSVKVEEPKPVVKPTVPVVPVVKTQVTEPQQVWYLGGSGGGGGGSGETANTPPAPLREGSLSTAESSISDGSSTIPSSEEGAGGVGGSASGDTIQDTDSMIQTITTTDSITQTPTTTPDAIQDSDSTTQVTTSTISTSSTPDTIGTATSTFDVTPVSAEATPGEQTTTTLDVIITTSTLEITVTSTEQIVTTTLEIVITTSTLEETVTSTLPIVETPSPPAVVINEIAWAGTASKKSDNEWVELYSNATSTIDLAGWKILVDDIREIKLSGVIAAGNYYLLERTKDKTVADITADNIFTLTGGLNNNGVRLRLVNGAGDVVDEVDSSGGWFAGDNIKYRSMSRKNAAASGNDPDNWFSSQGISAKGKADGGGVIYGSPKFSNYGYWLLKSPMFYYSDRLSVDKVLTLTKANSPYLVMSPTEIPAGYTLRIESGVVLIGMDKTSHLSVTGNLIADGAVEAPIVFTSALDTNYVQTNLTSLSGSAEAGDWSRIQIEPGGNFIGSFVKFLYGGRTFKKSMGAMAATYFYSNVIYNYGGSVSLDNAEFAFSYFDSSKDNEQYSELIFVEAPNGYDASLTINNSNFNGGWRAIKIFRQNNGQTISIGLTGDTFQNFQNPDSLILSKKDFVSPSESVFNNNASDNVQIDSWALTADYTLDVNTQYLFNFVSIPADVTLTIDPGVKIKLPEWGAIEAEGSIQANGTAEQPIVFETQTPGERWGYIKLKNSDSTFDYTNFIGGNRSNQGDPKDRGVLRVEDSTLNLNNISILDSRAPGNAIYSLNSNLNITNSVIGNATEPDFDMTGIKTDSGSVILDKVVLQNLKYGIRGDFNDEGLLPHLELNNMGAANFINVERPWEPNTWLSPAEDGE